MYRVAALYVVERYKPHVLEDIRRALRRARLAQARMGNQNPKLYFRPDLHATLCGNSQPQPFALPSLSAGLS